MRLVAGQANEQNKAPGRNGRVTTNKATHEATSEGAGEKLSIEVKNRVELELRIELSIAWEMSIGPRRCHGGVRPRDHGHEGQEQKIVPIDILEKVHNIKSSLSKKVSTKNRQAAHVRKLKPEALGLLRTNNTKEMKQQQILY